jgi:hypothetical protein
MWLLLFVGYYIVNWCERLDVVSFIYLKAWFLFLKKDFLR